MAAPPAVPPAPGAAAPGGPAGPQEMDELQMELLIQQAMFDLLQKPIIPDMLVFICSCLYLCTMLTTLIAGAVYFTYRLQPALPPPPAELTESTAIITDVYTTTTEAPKLWPKRSNEFPLICVIGFQTQPVNATRTVLEYLLATSTCDHRIMKETFDIDAGDLVLAGKRGNNEVEKLLLEQYGAVNLPKIVPAVLCCGVKLGDLGFYGIISSLYIKLRTNESMADVETYFIDNDVSDFKFLEIEENDVRRLTQPVIDKPDFIIVRSPYVTYDALAELKVAPLANSLREMLTVMSDALSHGIPPKKYCVLFTVSALEATLLGGGGINKFGERADSVTAIKQSKVCHFTDHIIKDNNTSVAVSLYRPATGGLPYYTFDTNLTIGVKVEEVLRANRSTCIVAYDVQNDDCPPPAPLTLTMQNAYDKKFHP